MEKERRKREEEERHVKQLDMIRQDNVQRRQEAIIKQQAQYRTSANGTSAIIGQSSIPPVSSPSDGIPMIPGKSPLPPKKKIEEDYTMFEEVKDDELEDIIEEEIEEDSDHHHEDDID